MITLTKSKNHNSNQNKNHNSNQNKNQKLIRRLLLFTIIINILLTTLTSNVTYAISDFGISPETMPEIPGTSNDHDELLYYVGVAAGIDPVFLKVIMHEESRGNADIADNKNSNGTTDYGLMQINSGVNGEGLASLGLTMNDVPELKRNLVMNLWASTEIIKRKHTMLVSNPTVDNESRSADKSVTKSDGSKAKYTMSHEAFSLFWAYNGVSEAGRNYAKRANDNYVTRTKLTLEESPLTDITNMKDTGALTPEQLQQIGMNPGFNTKTKFISVDLKETVTNPNTMTYEEFAELVEDVSSGKIIPGKYTTNKKIRDEYLEKYMDGVKDESKGTGVYYEQTSTDIIVNYKFYRLVKVVAGAINTVIYILAYLMVGVLALFWAFYMLALTGIYIINNMFMKITKIDALEQGSLRKMATVTIVSLIIISLILTGQFSALLEHVIKAVFKITL